MRRRALLSFALLTVAAPFSLSQTPTQSPADLVLLDARVWTVADSPREAQAVAIRGNRIVKVGSNADVQPFIRNGHTKVLRLPGRLVLPGFIDNHVHFAQAGRLLLGLNLLDVNDAKAFRERVGEGAKRLPAGAWLTGGDWGAYAQWGMSSTGTPSKQPAQGKAPAEFLPTRELIDSVTGDHPALIRRFDGQLYLANSLALKAANITSATPNPEGGEILRGADGQPNGLLRGTAAQLVTKAMPPASYAQRHAEALRALGEARKFGVTTMHDNTANFEQLALLQDLRRDGQLTSRMWARMWLSDWEAVRDYIAKNNVPAVSGGWGDDFIRLGGLKAWVDGIMGNSSALFFEPYTNNPQSSGRLRDVMFPEGNLYRLMKGADAAGFTVTVHAIGDKANRILLDTYEQVFRENPARDRRFRVVHAQVLHPDDFGRLKKMNLVAEVQPYHCIDDMRWMEERIGARSRTAYAFRTLELNGTFLSFGSDWPGTNAAYYTISPLMGMYAAVTRQTLNGQPPEGWFPGERISLENAVRYYTRNNAHITFEEKTKGTIEEGKLADLVVIDRDIFARPPRELKDARVLTTILDGKIVYEAAR